MPHQVALTVRAPVLPGRVQELKGVLDAAGAEDRRPDLLPFEHLPVHFARLFVVEDATDLAGAEIPATLFFLSDVDAPMEAYLAQLCRLAAGGLDQIFSLCAGYPADPTPQARAAYLTAHALKPAALYVNTVGRSLAQVHEEATLREAIGDFLDEQTAELAQKSPEEVRDAIAAHVGKDPALAWALKPAAPPEAAWRIGEAMHLAVSIVVGLILLPFILVGLPFYLVWLRIHETHDKVVRESVDRARIAELAAREDKIVQNQFTAVGLRKAGPFRGFTLVSVLSVIGLGARHLFNRGSLAGVRTIHFARWVFIDGHRRLLFASNYDGSLESYMDDFIDKVAFGLNAVFSNGVGYPKTNWLVFDGAKDELAFKALLRARQVDTPIWYSAYANLTALNVANNAAIRAGLAHDVSPAEAAAWAARL
jgi:hypothetical protein